MLGSAEEWSEAAGLVALPEETRDTILELNPKYRDQRVKVHPTNTGGDLKPSSWSN